MSNSVEKWWERVPRIIGGWGFALLVFLKFPFPDDPGPLAWSIYVGLMVFFIGIAHSTVTGIVLGSIGRVYSFVRRGGKERRDSIQAAGTTAIDIPIKDRRKR